jgi:hypothetical protein
MPLLNARKLYKIKKKSPSARALIAIGGEEAYDIGHPIGKKLSDAATPLPPPAPLPDEEQIRKAQRRMLSARAGRTGRRATILTGNDEPLG